MTMLLAQAQAAAAVPEGWLEFLKAYGLGVATMGVAIWFLVKQFEESKKREKELIDTVIALTRESLQSIAKMTQVVESLSPAIGALGATSRSDLEKATTDLKKHITEACEHLGAILNTRQS